jgi:hypothetical protein
MDQMPALPPRNHRDFVILIIALGLMFAAGFYLGIQQNVLNVQKSVINLSSPKVEYRLQAPSIIRSEQATAVGTIIKISGDQITVQGDDNSEVTFKLDTTFNLTLPINAKEASKAATPPVPTTDAQKIITGKKAVIFLNLQNHDFVVTGISYPFNSQ